MRQYTLDIPVRSDPRRASVPTPRAEIASAMGGTAVHALEDDTFSASLKCHDENGELYTVTFTRDRVTVGSYSDDAILTTVETWADTVPALA